MCGCVGGLVPTEMSGCGPRHVLTMRHGGDYGQATQSHGSSRYTGWPGFFLGVYSDNPGDTCHSICLPSLTSVLCVARLYRDALASRKIQSPPIHHNRARAIHTTIHAESQRIHVQERSHGSRHRQPVIGRCPESHRVLVLHRGAHTALLHLTGHPGPLDRHASRGDKLLTIADVVSTLG